MTRTAMLRGLLAAGIVSGACGAPDLGGGSGSTPSSSGSTAIAAPSCPPATVTPTPGTATPPGTSVGLVLRADTVMTVGSDSVMVIGADSVMQCIVLLLSPSTGNTTITIDRNP